MTEDLDRTTTAAPATPAGRSELRLRVLSALVMGPLVLALTWWGGVPFSLLLIACAVVMADEWSTIVLPAADTADRLQIGRAHV